MPNIRFGVRYSKDPLKDQAYLQLQRDEDSDFARPGELFINEPLNKLYYCDSTTGIVSELTTPTEAYPNLVAAPVAADSIGEAGQIAYDADFVYVCIAENIWKRSPLSTWVV